MIAVDSLGLVFLHNPKTGGCAVTRLLIDHYGGRQVRSPGLHWRDGVMWGHAWEVPAELTLYTRFTVIRHPLTRWASYYRHARHHGQFESSFDAFCKEWAGALPLQGHYARAAHVVIPYGRLAAGLYSLGLDTARLSRENRLPGRVRWTTELRSKVASDYRSDFIHWQASLRAASPAGFLVRLPSAAVSLGAQRR